MSFIYRSQRVGKIIAKQCCNCGVSFKCWPYQITSAKYCSRKCRAISVGNNNKLAANHKWKGDKAGYVAKHMWVSNNYGRPAVCSNCDNLKAKKYEWANISGNYKRDITDWIRLCTHCHRLMDGHGIKAAPKAWITRKMKYGNSGKKYVVS